eukprot:CAMPEP_0201981722 /NCGR_PEP_ID=MMETSP0904-20121228/74529_1 /ASSEMBLY_ACC=CAM_ASM_000553 /TAXON_ID=420261 /ORGANISM="Thalassiosira antarctica, Strain CCMP982" /LENGTH=45 /DNA_ID= /DNA_START= /DNA_END= /DNA_ORIENTATION=
MIRTRIDFCHCLVKRGGNKYWRSGSSVIVRPVVAQALDGGTPTPA